MDSKQEEKVQQSKLDPNSEGSMVTMKESSPVTSAPPRASTASNSDTTSAAVRDGKMIHVRVTLGYLRGISLKKSKRGGKRKGHFDQGSVMSAFAELEPGVHQSEYGSAASRPMSLTSDVATAVWPYIKKEGEEGSHPTSSKTKRRLYFSALLKKDENIEVAEEESELESDCGDESPDVYSPEVVNIRLGLIHKGLKIPLGIASLCLNGREISSRRIELAVRAPTYADKFNGDAPVRRGLFGKRAKPNRKFGLEPNAVLHLRLDVKDSVYSLSGPSLWGDLDEDDDSFSPNIPTHIRMMAPDDQRQRGVAAHEEHESIEVLRDLSGTTIFASLEKKSDSPGTGDGTNNASVAGSIAPVGIDPRKETCEEEIKQPAAAAAAAGCPELDYESGAEPWEVEVPCLLKAGTKQAKKETLDDEKSHEECSTLTPSTEKSSKDGGSGSNKEPTLHKRSKSGTELDMLLVRIDESSLSAGSSSYSGSRSLDTDGSSLSRSTISGSTPWIW